MGDSTWDVFVSYSHHDATWLKASAQTLHHPGVDVFLDVWNLIPGQPVLRRLEEGLRSRPAAPGTNSSSPIQAAA